MPRFDVRHSVGREFYDDGYDSLGDEDIGNRLNFSKLKFYGREEELRLLIDVYRKLCHEGELSIPFPLISGFAGCGKSSLVDNFMEHLNTEANRGFLLRGKFEKLQSTGPFSAIVEAFGGLSSQIMNRDEKEVEQLRQDIKSAMGNEALIELTNLFQGLKDVLRPVGKDYYSTEAPFPCIGSSTENTWNRLKYIFRTFIKAICTKDRPVVIFLDDLQWANNSSIDLIEALLSDNSIRYFMFVGAFRLNAKRDNLEKTRVLDNMGKKGLIQNIGLKNLSMKELGQLVSDSLNLFEEETFSLTKAVYTKTLGNVFFAKQMLEDLQRRNILHYSMISFRWEWDQHEIYKKVEMSDDVIDVVASKIESTPIQLQKALSIAACTRSSFSIDVLESLMNATGHLIGLHEVHKILELAIKEGILSKTDDSENYKFAHDRIQEAAYSLIPSEERVKLRAVIGRCLLDLASSSDAKDEWMFFVAADHFNSINSKNCDRAALARLNLLVGEKAASVASFDQALSYLSKGLTVLRQIKNHWIWNYDLSLQLHRATSNVELTLGHFETGQEIAEELLCHAKNNAAKLPTFFSLGLALARQGRHKESSNCHWTALKLLGEKRILSQNLMVVLYDFAFVNRFLNTHTNDEILNLALLRDPILLQKMKFYDEAGTRAFMCGNATEFMFIQLRKIRLSFKYGLCTSTAFSFANHAMTLDKFGNHNLALRLAKLSREVLDMTNKADSVHVCTRLALNLCNSWIDTPSNSIQDLQQISKLGMGVGVFQYGCTAKVMSVNVAFFSGYPLEKVEKARIEVDALCRLYNISSCCENLHQNMIIARHLMGSANFDFQSDQFGPLTNDGSDSVRLSYGYLSRLGLAVYFREFGIGLRYIKELRKCSDSASVLFWQYVFIRKLFFTGLIYSGLARETRKKKYIFMARGKASDMKHLSKRGGFQSSHLCMIMEAELLTLGKHRHKRSNCSKVLDSYKAAAQAASNANHIHDAALCNELAGEYFLTRGQQQLGGKFLTEAKNLYKKWGAKTKVEHIEKTRGTYINMGGNRTKFSSSTASNFTELTTEFSTMLSIV